jgi:AcrR family transcriptional regulator
MHPVRTPRQARSQETQERLLTALETLLEQRVFEKITIQDIAAEAGVAVGTVYRRFRDKQALLPVLYGRLGDRLAAWGEGVWRGYRGSDASAPDGGLETAMRRLVSAHVRFYRDNAPILRTLYLQVRLDGELADPRVGQRRRELYEALLAPIWACLERADWPLPDTPRAHCFVLLLLSPLTERYLFPENTPASVLPMSDRRFVTELSEALCKVLRPERAGDSSRPVR